MSRAVCRKDFVGSDPTVKHPRAYGQIKGLIQDDVSFFHDIDPTVVCHLIHCAALEASAGLQGTERAMELGFHATDKLLVTP